MAKVIIPMHYRDGSRGGHRLEMVRDFVWHFESPDFIHYYDTDTLAVTPDMEPQVAVLQYLGPEAWGALTPPERKAERRGLLAKLLGKK